MKILIFVLLWSRVLSVNSLKKYVLCWVLGLLSVLFLLAETLALQVVTSVAPVTDMVQQVGGGLIQVHGLVPEGVNSHTFQPAPGDLRHLVGADLVIMNGLGLEVPLEKLARSSGRPGLKILKLGDNTISKPDWVFDFSFPKAQGNPNPHLWLNVVYAMRYVELIRDQLRELDSANAAAYERHAAAYLAQLTRLDHCLSVGLATVPSAQRKLLTYHDSWPYFARRYGLSVIGAMQPANFAEPSPREVARLIDQLRREKVPAVFGSEVFPSKVLQKIAREAGVRYVTALRDDALPGALGDADHTYVGMMRHNVMAMVEALGGQPATLTSCLQEAATR
ncbi:MAG: metal ABC transporter substrate-binding protein [Candidatus Tectimicrobiota bacterium]